MLRWVLLRGNGLKKEKSCVLLLSLAVFLKNLRGHEMEAVAPRTRDDGHLEGKKRALERISSFLSPVPPCLFSCAVGYCRVQKNPCVRASLVPITVRHRGRCTMRSVPFRCANASKYLSLPQPPSAPAPLSRACSGIRSNASLSLCANMWSGQQSTDQGTHSDKNTCC